MVDVRPADGTRESRDAHAAAMADYAAAGAQRAADLGIRGPLRLTDDGLVHPDIVDAYRRHGAYIFEGIVDAQEVAELRADVDEWIDRAPSGPRASTDRHGRPWLGEDWAVNPYLFIEPLSDPWGGTDALAGRHPEPMAQPTPDEGAPDHVLYLLFGMCQAMPSGLRLYGHPGLLAIAATINGPDFVPYNDAVFVKEPGLGGAVAWHQDGVTHWDSPQWDDGIHGFNFQVQLHPTTPANALWVMPGTHTAGRADITAMVEANGGDDRLPGAVPLVCDAGDATIANRQIVHGSFANSSPDPRVSVTFGFHRRASVLGVTGGLSLKNRKGSMGHGDVYDEQRIFDRSAVIAVAIDARHQHRPDESRFTYGPFAGLEDDFRFGDDTVERVIRDYNTRDLAI